MDIEKLRAEIDRLDREIVKLVCRRAEVVKKVGELKRERDAEVYVPSREHEVLKRACKSSDGPITDDGLKAIFREIISACRALERPIRVAFLGPEGTFTDAAAKALFGACSDYVPVGTLDAVFSEVELRKADYGVVPVENSTEGGIYDTLCSFIDSDLKVCGEITCQIRHYLMGKCSLSDVRAVHSKATVFTQCRKWLAQNLPNAAREPATSTAEAAKTAAGTEAVAVIGSRELADIYDLNVLAERIEDNHNNHTRFFVLGHEMAEPTGEDKTSLLCSVRDRPGALCDLLLELKQESINMTKIESFPSPREAFQYYFFIDLTGHCKDPEVQRALAKVREHCVEFKVLGAYPRG